MDSSELITLRVQYLADADPFNSVSMFPIPARAKYYSFISNEPLATQLAPVLRLLDAPQRVRFFSFNFSIFLDNRVDKNREKTEWPWVR